MTCKECIHEKVCVCPTTEATSCDHFKNKADFVEVRHGEWEYWQPDGTKHLWNCSVCNNAISTPMPFVAKHIAYCEHCGAKMNVKGGVRDEQR